MKKSKKAENNSKTIYYVHIEIGHNLGNRNTHGFGLPLTSRIYADNYEEATEIANKCAKQLANNLSFTNRNLFAEMSKGCKNEFASTALNTYDYKFSTPHNLDVLKVEVSETELITTWGDAHNAKLTEMINKCWGNTLYHNRFNQILRPYFERDKSELANLFCESKLWEKLADNDYDFACKEIGWEEVAYEWFNHSADDEDLRAVLNYLRPVDLYPNQEWYGVTTQELNWVKP